MLVHGFKGLRPCLLSPMRSGRILWRSLQVYGEEYIPHMVGRKKSEGLAFKGTHYDQFHLPRPHILKLPELPKRVPKAFNT